MKNPLVFALSFLFVFNVSASEYKEKSVNRSDVIVLSQGRSTDSFCYLREYGADQESNKQGEVLFLECDLGDELKDLTFHVVTSLEYDLYFIVDGEWSLLDKEELSGEFYWNVPRGYADGVLKKKKRSKNY
ncbi:hypothetical protein [Photobacterium leiognathi]|uniref:hypothetical protein n=1 Tax=Photobacterium leiognathi TaxID=553611 RepID=UPI002980E53B|nr:hypothetical protein [Photobacterium leiognathi]